MYYNFRYEFRRTFDASSTDFIPSAEADWVFFEDLTFDLYLIAQPMGTHISFSPYE